MLFFSGESSSRGGTNHKSSKPHATNCVSTATVEALLATSPTLTQIHRPSHQSDEPLGEDADDDGGKRGHSKRDAHADADRKAGFLQGLAHEHGIRNPHVIVKSKNRIQHTQGCQNIVSALH